MKHENENAQKLILENKELKKQNEALKDKLETTIRQKTYNNYADVQLHQKCKNLIDQNNSLKLKLKSQLSDFS